MHPLLITTLCLLIASILLFYMGGREILATRRAMASLGAGRRSLQDLGARSGAEKLGKSDPETLVLLNQLGWRSNSRKAMFFAIQIALPMALTLLAALLLLGSDDSSAMSWIGLFVAFAVGYLIPKRVLANRVAKRKERMATEVSQMIPLLRMLFDVGMTVEQALRVLCADAGKILPELTQELRYALARTDAGLELGSELREIAATMQVDDLTDCFTILQQLIYQGGGAMNSLLALKQLLDDRRMTTLEERVSKMSAKMSVVMMLFLFPALLIILAGPGFVAIIQALGDMG